jgi:hypothetical protein
MFSACCFAVGERNEEHDSAWHQLFRTGNQKLGSGINRWAVLNNWTAFGRFSGLFKKLLLYLPRFAIANWETSANLSQMD